MARHRLKKSSLAPFSFSTVLALVDRGGRIDQVRHEVNDLPGLQVAGGPEPRHVRAREVGPRVVDLFVRELRDLCAVAALQTESGQFGSDVADVDLAGGERVAVLAQPAVLLALFEDSVLDAIACAV